MPCFCNIPYEGSQIGIERLSKIRMYIKAKSVLTKEQLKKFGNVEIEKLSIIHVNEQLCKICKVLTENQMRHISAYYWQIRWPHETLYDWYIQHCKDDEKFNKSLLEKNMKVKITESTVKEIDLNVSITSVSEMSSMIGPVISIWMTVNNITHNSVIPLSSFANAESALGTLNGVFSALVKECYKEQKNGTDRS